METMRIIDGNTGLPSPSIHRISIFQKIKDKLSLLGRVLNRQIWITFKFPSWVVIAILAILIFALGRFLTS